MNYLASLCFLATLLCQDHLPERVVEKKMPVPAVVTGKSWALVELFTSEGCSSCPPAERLVSELEAQTQKAGQSVFFLNFHVDYWNRLGWKDRFSQADFTMRQYAYARKFKGEGVYTPQIVVNGNEAFVGSNRQHAETALSQSLARNIPDYLTVEMKQDKLFYKINNHLTDRQLWLAVSEKNAETQVKAGENAGKHLTYRSVVVELVPVKDLQVAGSFALRPEWLTNRYSITAFLQNTRTMEVMDVARVW
jgi:hypothetical protein